MERYLLVVSDADEIAAVNLLEVISARRVAQYNHVTASGVGYGASSFVPQYACVVSFVDPFLREACSGIYLPPTIPPVLCLSSAMFLFMEFRVYNWNWGSKTVSELSFLTSDRLVSAMKVCIKWASAVLFAAFSKTSRTGLPPDLCVAQHHCVHAHVPHVCPVAAVSMIAPAAPHVLGLPRTSLLLVCNSSFTLE